MNRRAGKFFAVIILALALVFTFTTTAMAEDENTEISPDGVPVTVHLAVSETIKYDMNLQVSGTLTYEFTVNEEKAGINISGKPGTGGMMSDTFVKAGETVTKSRELEAGEYTVILTNDSTNRMEADCTYKISFKPSGETYGKQNNTIETASGPLTMGKKITGFFAMNDSVDIYKIDLKNSGRLTLKVSDINATMLTLMDGQGNSVPKYPTTIGTSKPSTSASYDLLKGVYYAKFEKTGNAGVCHLVASFKNANETYVDKLGSTKVLNGSTSIKLNKVVKGQLAENDEDDLYTVYIPKAGDYNITVKVDSSYKAKVWPFSVDSLYKSAKYDTRAEYSNQDSELQKTFIYRGLKKGKYYVYLKKGSDSSPATGPYSFVVKPAPVNNYKPVAGKKKLTAKWEKGTGTGYQVQIALNKSFTSGKKSATITKASTVSKVFKSLKAKKKYYVRVRSYVSYNGTKYYSNWSNKTYVTTKG